MPTINISLDVKIHNYKEIAANKSGAFAAFLAGIPLAGFFVESKIDSELVKQVEEKLGIEVSKALQKELSDQGVKASVNPK
jgi:hypothetical protein